MAVTRSHRLLLLSGGIDSSAIAYGDRPDATLFVDYGQRPAASEARAAAAVAVACGLPHFSLEVPGTSALGIGVLANEGEVSGAPSPEWWPFRNQLLVTLAAAWLIKHQPTQAKGAEILVGSVRDDGARHRDGTADFYEAISRLTSLQEFNITVRAPRLALSTVELVRESRIGPDILGWTHSCHRADFPCGNCPGCYKRAAVLEKVKLL